MRGWLALGLMLPLAAWAQALDPEGNVREAGSRDEVRAQLPEYPKPENFLRFRVSETASFEFFVDAKSVSVGKDGVVRYSLIAKSPDGALNVSFEGIRCSDGRFRIYAFGRPDKTWSEARGALWQAMPADSRNAQRTALFSEYFCPGGGIIYTAEEGVQALRAGRHPRGTYSRY